MRVLLLVLAACGGPKSDGALPSDDADSDVDTDADTDTVPPDPETVPLAGPCAPDALFGSFGVESDGLLTVVAGAVADGVVPVTVLEPTASEGDCTLLSRVQLFCDPPCSSDETCDFDGTCIPYPAQQDLGTVAIDGLLDPVSMEPSSPGFNYYQLGLPLPPYDPGVLISLRAEGAALPAFALYGVGLVPLDPPVAPWVLSQASDAAITWVAPGGPVRSTVHLLVTIDQHGTSPLQLDCNFPDTGLGTVPATLVQQLVASGVTGFPTASIERRTVDSTAIGTGCVQFAVSWSAIGDVVVEGYTPCTDPSDCPSGQTCNTHLEICE